MPQGAELIAKVFGLLSESNLGVVNAVGGALNAELRGGSELADRPLFLDPRPWPPRSRAAVALEELRIPSKTRVPSAFEFGVISANHLVQNLRMRESLGLEMSAEELGGQCGLTAPGAPPIPIPELTKYRLGMLAGLAAVPAEDRADLPAIGKATDMLTNLIGNAL
jgi:hypothetical protein